MSSNEEDFNDNENLNPRSKKRKVTQRACDLCRRRKIRCDYEMSGNRCSHCITYSFECTYSEPPRKHGPLKGYIERMEKRVEKLEKVLTLLFPGSNILNELNAAVDIDAWLIDRIPCLLADRSEASVNSSHTPPPSPPLSDLAVTAVIRKMGTEQNEHPQDDDFSHELLARNFQKLNIDDVEKSRFFGKSSSGMLLHTAMELKNEYTGGNSQRMRQNPGWKREEFWIPSPWETTAPQAQKAIFVFPEDDLLASLLDLYFENYNIFFPLLHRPSYKRAVAEGLHLRDDGFGLTLLLVCAIASRFSDDPRVLMDGVESSYSGGWKWYHQAQSQVRRPPLVPASLYDLQFYSLSVVFLLLSSTPQAGWTMAGIGIRLAQDVGAHRRKFHRNNNMTMEDELWKRAFWVLVSMDRITSSGLGRTCAIQEEDFDVDFLIECDDEYWEHPDPAQRFKQPPNKPSYITSFNVLLKLIQIMAMMLRTIYSINKHKVTLGLVGQEYDQHIVAELDSALNKWVDSLPDHLRWDPARKEITFFQQSACLYCMYYHIQILIHRSFIPSPRKTSPFFFPSLAICTNAARSSSRIIDVYHSRGLVAPPILQMTIFTAALVLLLNIWGEKCSGLPKDLSKEMVDVHKCMQALRKCESRWASAGRRWDTLYELASMGELPLPSTNTSPSDARNTDSSHTTNSPTIPSSDAPRMFAGSRRVTWDANTLGKQCAGPSVQPQSSHGPQSPFSLPLYSHELGRFPASPQAQFGAVPHQTPPMFEQGRCPPPPGWRTEEPLTGTTSQPDPPTGTRPFNLNLYSPIEFGYDNPPPAQSSSASGTLRSSLEGTESLGAGTATMHPDQPPSQMIAGEGQYLSGMNLDMRELEDGEASGMWSNAPCIFGLDDWGMYLANFSELTHGMYPSPAGG